jgi:hypothetical protein
VWLLDIVSFFSAGLWYVLYAYFILLSSRLSVTHTICLHFYFLVSRPSVRRTIFSFYFILIICSRAKCYRASTVWGHECKSSCPVLQLQSADYLERWRAALNEAGKSVVVNCNEETHIRDLNSMQLTYNSIIPCLCTINSSTLDVAIYCECVQPEQFPVLTWDSSSVPPGTTSMIRSPPGSRRIQHVYMAFT